MYKIPEKLEDQFSAMYLIGMIINASEDFDKKSEKEKEFSMIAINIAKENLKKYEQ